MTTTRSGSEPLVLADGRQVLLRPLTIEDEDALRRAFEDADARVLRSRFGGGVPPFASIVARLHLLDGRGRYAVAALDDQGDVVGVAEYARTGPDAPAEVAVIVASDWQRQGIGTALLRRLAEHALGVGITSATALISGSNEQVLELLDDLSVPHSVSYDHGSGTVRADLAAAPATSAPA